MSKLDDYKKAKAAADYATGWNSMIGAKYYGGTSGRGELGCVRSASVSMTIYYQHSDGSKNYHESPEALNSAMAAVLKRNHKALIDEAISDLENAAKKAAEDAAAEYTDLLKAAGITQLGATEIALEAEATEAG